MLNNILLLKKNKKWIFIEYIVLEQFYILIILNLLTYKIIGI